MNSKKKIYTWRLMVFLLLIINGLLLARVRSINNQRKKLIIQQSTFHDIISNKQHIIETKDWLQFESENDEISSSIEVIDENKNKIQLKEMLSKQPKLVFRYSELNCQQCVDTVFKRLKQLAEEVGKEKILILSSYSNHRDLLLFKRINQIDLEVYNLNETKLDISVEEVNIPYMFLLDNDFRAKFVFIPEKTMPQLTDNYLLLIKNKMRQVFQPQ
jgi:hypothetical protein